jgi:hypothetical protein
MITMDAVENMLCTIRNYLKLLNRFVSSENEFIGNLKLNICELIHIFVLLHIDLLRII